MGYLEEAILVAESPELKFRLYCEHAAKLLSLNRPEEADNAITTASGLATTDRQQEEIANLRSEADKLADYYTQLRDNAERDQAAQARTGYVRAMRLRLQLAEARGDQAAVQRYNERISALEESSAE